MVSLPLMLVLMSGSSDISGVQQISARSKQHQLQAPKVANSPKILNDSPK